MKVRLTSRSIDALKPQAKPYIVWDDKIAGFGLRVAPKGKRQFFLYYRTKIGKTQRRPHIGEYPNMRPEDARVIAKLWIAEVAKGNDPSLVRQQAKEKARSGEGLLSDLFKEYCAAKAELRSLSEVERIFEKDILPTLGKMRAEDVKRSDVTRLLDKLAKRSPTVASNARRRLSAFYNWALPRLPDNAINPVLGSVSAPAPAARERVLSDEELRALWSVLEDEQEPWRTALRLMILTGQRRGEVFDASWSEFDLTEKLWTIPAERAKNGKAHVVPLSPQVLELLQALPRHGPVFLRSEGVSRFVKLTGRSEREVAGARWQEFDLAKGVWRLSKKRADDSKAVEVALSEEARVFLTCLIHEPAAHWCFGFGGSVAA